MADLQAVLFDMDGTVCDTEPAWMATEGEMARRYDAEWTTEDGLALVGNNLLDSGRYLKHRMGLAAPVEEIVDELLDGVMSHLAAGTIEWRPGALELISACNEAGLPTALVTMSYRRFADAVVNAMPYGRFDAVITGDEVANGKPAPDSYLTAAAALGVEAGRCVAIEDSPVGAASAYAAGCRVVVVPNHVPVSMAASMVLWPTLVGQTVDSLAGALSER